MPFSDFIARQRHQRNALILSLITMTLSLAASDGQQTKTLSLTAGAGQPAGALHIGTSGSLTAADDSGTGKGALDGLASLMKDETGLGAKIVRQNGWRELADNLAKGQFQLGFFQGYEFAWASEKNP